MEVGLSKLKTEAIVTNCDCESINDSVVYKNNRCNSEDKRQKEKIEIANQNKGRKVRQCVLVPGIGEYPT